MMQWYWSVGVAVFFTWLIGGEAYAGYNDKMMFTDFVREVSTVAPVVRDGFCFTAGWLISHFFESMK